MRSGISLCSQIISRFMNQLIISDLHVTVVRQERNKNLSKLNTFKVSVRLIPTYYLQRVYIVVQGWETHVGTVAEVHIFLPCTLYRTRWRELVFHGILNTNNYKEQKHLPFIMETYYCLKNNMFLFFQTLGESPICFYVMS